LDAFPPGQFIGKALVIDCRSLSEGEAITIDYLKKYGEKADQADFLLFNLGWDRRWGTDAYFCDYPCIDAEVLEYIIGGDYKGIGFDVIGLDPIADDNLTRHKRLFESKDIVNIENLCNLALCGSELFWFSCFPLKISDCDGSPVRAVAWFE
jgi:kynurenine formamidase